MEKNAERRTIRVSLADFPKRPDRCTKASVEVSFSDADHLRVRVADLGFGDIFPAEDAEEEEYVEL
jgi:hypothetical protein